VHNFQASLFHLTEFIFQIPIYVLDILKMKLSQHRKRFSHSPYRIELRMLFKLQFLMNE